MEDIFISYRRSDSSLQASSLKRCLEALGYSCFLDVEDIDESKGFPAQLEQRIRSAKDFILILSNDALICRGKDDYLYKEMKVAFDRQKEDPSFKTHVAVCPGFSFFKKDLHIPEDFEEPFRHFSELTFLEILDFKADEATNIARLSFSLANANLASERISSGSLRSNSAAYASDNIPPHLLKRMNIQAKIRLENDYGKVLELAKQVKAKVNKETLNVLDVGCGNAIFSGGLFGKDPIYGQVLGFDRSPDMIQKAKECVQDLDNPEKFDFFQLDLSSPDFASSLLAQMKAKGIKKFDIILCSHVLRHLGKPLEAINKLLSFLNVGGLFLIHEGDDGTKMLYSSQPGIDAQEMLQEVRRVTAMWPKKADFYFGRKVYGLLHEARLSNIHVCPETVSNTSLDPAERISFLLAIYDIHFGWRGKELIPDEHDTDETKEELSEINRKMKEALAKIEPIFHQADAFYSYTDFFCYGIKSI